MQWGLQGLCFFRCHVGSASGLLFCLVASLISVAAGAQAQPMWVLGIGYWARHGDLAVPRCLQLEAAVFWPHRGKRSALLGVVRIASHFGCVGAVVWGARSQPLSLE